MSKPMIRIHNMETDEIIDREMNDEEYAVWLQGVKEDEARFAEEQKKAKAKSELLAKLGLTEEEAKLLLG